MALTFLKRGRSNSVGRFCDYRSGGRCTPIPDIKPKKGTIFQTTSALFKTHHRLCLASGFCRNSKTTITTMAFSRLRLLLPFLLCPILFISHPVICDGMHFKTLPLLLLCNYQEPSFFLSFLFISLVSAYCFLA